MPAIFTHGIPSAYPGIFSELPDGYMADVPDMQINTQGDDQGEAIAAARDAIGLMGIDMEDDQKALPAPSPQCPSRLIPSCRWWISTLRRTVTPMNSVLFAGT